MEVNGAGRAQARPVTFTGIGTTDLLGSFFILYFCLMDCCLVHLLMDCRSCLANLLVCLFRQYHHHHLYS